MSPKAFFSRNLKRLGLRLSQTADELHISERNHLKAEFDRRDLTEMLKTSFPLDTSSIAVDVGGYRGDWASDIYSRYRCRILVLEPVPLFCEHLRRRFAQNPNIKIVQVGLGAHSREEDISLQADGTSFLRQSRYTQTVRMLSAFDFFTQEKLERVGLMKINIEGSEYELLEHLAQSNLLKNIDNLLVQFHDIAPDSTARMLKIRETLSLTHRRLFSYDFVWEAWTLK